MTARARTNRGRVAQNASSARWMTPEQPRRSLFQSSLQNSRVNNSSIHSPGGLYGRTIEDTRDDHWQPGEVISPSPVHEDTIDELKRSMHSMISDMQASLSAEFRCLQDSVCALSDRVQVVETQLESAAQTPSSSGSEFESPMGRRKRRIPLELQSRIREVYKNLPHDKKLKLNERIDSEYNGAIVKAVCDGLDNQLNIEDVRYGLSTYRKSLKRTPTDSEKERKLQRSRQQRVWDRRSKHITNEESEKWKDVHPSMMSDEETVDSKTLKRKRPAWRSPELNEMIDRIEQRYECASNHPRKERGSPLKCVPPPTAKEWMVASSPPSSP